MSMKYVNVKNFLAKPSEWIRIIFSIDEWYCVCVYIYNILCYIT